MIPNKSRALVSRSNEGRNFDRYYPVSFPDGESKDNLQPDRLETEDHKKGKIIKYPVTSREYLRKVAPLVDLNHHSLNLSFKYSLEKRQPINPIRNQQEADNGQILKMNSASQEKEYKNMQFEQLKEKLVQEIRYRLKSSRTYSINELYKQIESREEFEALLEDMKTYVRDLLILNSSIGNPFCTSVRQINSNPKLFRPC